MIVIPKKYSVFIQTDKPVYKPGNEILYRVLVLDSNLKPYKAQDLNIEIFDGEGNLLPFEETKQEIVAPPGFGEPGEEKEDVFEGGDSNEVGDSPTRSKRNAGNSKRDNLSAAVQRDNGKIFDGLYAYHYNISDEANTGNWSIKVTIDNEPDFATTKYFMVKEYILPRFEVIINVKSEVLTTDPEIQLTVHGNYTFGELVTGEVTVTPTVYDPDHENLAQKKRTKTAKANFNADFSFKMVADLGISNSIKAYVVRFDVEFVEELTGQKMTKTAKVRVYRSNEYIIEIVPARPSFKPGFKYSFGVNVRSLSGKPVNSQIHDLKAHIKYLLKPKRCQLVNPNQSGGSEQEFHHERRLINGYTNFTLNVPDTATAIIITASYVESETSINVLRHLGQTDEYLMIEAKKKTG